MGIVKKVEEAIGKAMAPKKAAEKDNVIDSAKPAHGMDTVVQEGEKDA